MLKNLIYDISHSSLTYPFIVLACILPPQKPTFCNNAGQCATLPANVYCTQGVTSICVTLEPMKENK